MIISIRNHILTLFVIFCSVSTGCVNSDKVRNVTVSCIDTVLIDNDTLFQYEMINSSGMAIRLTNYAAALTDVSVPDRNGKMESVVLGFDSISEYTKPNPKYGSTVGRYANRIKNAEFELDGKHYILEKNNKGIHSIHGGSKGFNLRVFDVCDISCDSNKATIVFACRSPHLDGGFPGNLDFSISYTLTDNNEIILNYEAHTDAPTVVNFTNHSYFNLSGCNENVLSHNFYIKADSMLVTDSGGIPTGKIVSVKKSDYDFMHYRKISFPLSDGEYKYDTSYKLSKTDGELSLAAIVEHQKSGRRLKAYTTEPGMQFYISNSDMKRWIGHGNKRYMQYAGFCLEMQHFPDSPNHLNFPSTALYPNQVYRQTTIYKFETF